MLLQFLRVFERRHSREGTIVFHRDFFLVCLGETRAPGLEADMLGLFNLDPHDFVSLTNSSTRVSCLGLSQLARTTRLDTTPWIPIIRVHVCNLGAIGPSDPTRYAGLGEFFYRKLKPGVRSVDNSVLVSGATFVSRLQRLTVKRVSPVDGTLHGTIDGMRVEEVKDITYSLDRHCSA